MWPPWFLHSEMSSDVIGILSLFLFLSISVSLLSHSSIPPPAPSLPFSLEHLFGGDEAILVLNAFVFLLQPICTLRKLGMLDVLLGDTLPRVTHRVFSEPLLLLWSQSVFQKTLIRRTLLLGWMRPSPSSLWAPGRASWEENRMFALRSCQKNVPSLFVARMTNDETSGYSAHRAVSGGFQLAFRSLSRFALQATSGGLDLSCDLQFCF